MLRFIVLTSLLAVAYAATDYCQASLCPSGKHIACQNNGAWASTCPKTPTPSLASINQNLAQYITAYMNNKRNTVALGQLTIFSSAKNMFSLKWNQELADLAAYTAKTCLAKRDACHNTETFTNSGQNVALISYPKVNVKTNKELATRAMDFWWKQNENANMDAINSYPSSWPNPILSFTMMCQEKNTDVGCAIANYIRDNRKQGLVVCNFAVNNVVGEPVYEAGETASGCTQGTNPNYPGLCK